MKTAIIKLQMVAKACQTADTIKDRFGLDDTLVSPWIAESQTAQRTGVASKATIHGSNPGIKPQSESRD